MACEKKQMTCIICPVGCPLTVTFDGGKVVSVEGNTCSRGEKYARSEAENPVRTVTSTVKVIGGEIPLVPVRTDAPVPKGKMSEVMAAVRSARVSAPIKTGDVLISDIAGANIIATRDIAAK